MPCIKQTQQSTLTHTHTQAHTLNDKHNDRQKLNIGIIYAGAKSASPSPTVPFSFQAGSGIH